MDPSFADRYLNEGFSGGEKKRNEILQMAILEPEIAILDETDSGLDIDALRVVAKGVARGPGRPPRARHPGHHPLPAPARRPRRPTSCTSSSTAASSSPAARSWPRDSSPRATTHGDVTHDRPARRRAPVKADFPLLARDGARQAARLPRLGRHLAEAAPWCSTRWTHYYETINANVHRGVYAHRRGGHRRPRGAPGPRSPRFIERPLADRDRLHQERHRGAQPRRAVVGPGQPRRGRRRRAHPAWSTTPTSSRGSMLAAEKGIEIRWIPLTADGQLDLTDLDRLLDGAKLLGVTAMSNVLGTITPVRRLADAAHAAGAIGVRRRAASPCRTSPPTCRRSAPTSSPSPATRCCGPTGIGVLWGREELLDAMPPFLGGGEMIRDVTPRRVHHQRPALEVRGRHAADRRGHRPRRRRRLPRRRSAWTPCGRHEMALTAYALDTLDRALRRRPHASTARRTPTERGGVLSLRLRGHPPPRPRRRCSTSTPCACAPATTAPSR